MCVCVFWGVGGGGDEIAWNQVRNPVFSLTSDIPVLSLRWRASQLGCVLNLLTAHWDLMSVFDPLRETDYPAEQITLNCQLPKASVLRVPSWNPHVHFLKKMLWEDPDYCCLVSCASSTAVQKYSPVLTCCSPVLIPHRDKQKLICNAVKFKVVLSCQRWLVSRWNCT